MGSVNTRVVRRSAELLNGMYGSDFQYNEGVLSGKGADRLFSATGTGVGTGVFVGAASVSFTRGLMQKFLPKPGEVPVMTRSTTVTTISSCLESIRRTAIKM